MIQPVVARASDHGNPWRRLAPDPGRGLFVVIEGLDGAGTTTQAALTASWLSEHGVEVVNTFEPSDGPLGAVTRAAVQGRMDLDPLTLALSFSADRTDHLHNRRDGILHLVSRGTWVICDRYVLSSLAYQTCQGVPLDWLVEVNSFAVDPDVTVFVDASVDVCATRIHNRSGDEEMFHGHETLRGVRDAYKKVLARGRFIGALVTADGDGSIVSVQRQIQEGLLAQFERLPVRFEGVARLERALARIATGT